MFCTSCGKKIKDDSKFCPFCGQNIGQPTNQVSTQPSPGGAGGTAAKTQMLAQPAVAQQAAAQQAAAAQPAPAALAPARGMSEQVGQARSSSRKKMPMFVFVVLVTLALAGTAFAAAYIYTNFIAPNNATSRTSEQEASQQSASQEQTPESVYDGKLAQWVTASLSNWPDESDSGDADLANVSDVASGRATNAPGVPRSLLDDKTVQFAYKDLNGDDKPELIIAVPYEEEYSDTKFAPIAIYTTDNSDNVISVTDGIGSITSIWTLYKNGYLQCGGGGNGGGQNLYQIQDGAVVTVGEYSNRDLLSGAVSMPDRGEAYTYADFEWTDLAAMGDLVNDEILAREEAETSAAVDAILASMHSYENDYFYVDSDSNVDTTVTDNGNGTWTVQWKAKPGAQNTGGRAIVHMGGAPTQYSDQVGTASNGQLIWVEGVAGGTCGTFGVK